MAQSEDQPQQGISNIPGKLNMAKLNKQQTLQNQIRRLTGWLEKQQKLHSQIVHMRLAAFLLAAVISGFVFFEWGAEVWFPVTVIVFAPFVGLAIWHRRVENSITRLSHYRAIKQAHLARLTLDWEQLPPPLPMPENLEHPFARDLDLIGTRSLHRLLDTAVTDEGSTRLRDWLLDTRPAPAAIAYRQALIAELAPLSRFRDRLALQGRLAKHTGRFSPHTILTWLEQTPPPSRYRRPLIVLTLLIAASYTLSLFAGITETFDFSLITWPLYLALYFLWGYRQIGRLFRDLLMLQDTLETTKVVFDCLEGAEYGRAPHVHTLLTPFHEAARPSGYLRRLRRLMVGVSLGNDSILGFVINLLLPWNMFFAYRLAIYREELAGKLPVWLDTWYELEALNGLANFAWLNTGQMSFPEIDTAVTPALSAQEIGHPLVTADKRIHNDFAISGPGTIFLITGSNMAGKSTFLRTIGVNLALAYAGGPVLATTMHTSLFRLFASIQVADSLTDGFSFFYAEVRRLQQLLNALPQDEARPLLFLIDEIFRGTNNRERLIGSRAYIRTLAEGSGLGLIATHDLELVHLGEENGRIHNFHFRDEVVDGRMIFDYKLHPGPCPTTNALKIMQLAGLPITNSP
jgi:ABC-type multidrug transport system fused ATPase/permease subunit